MWDKTAFRISLVPHDLTKSLLLELVADLLELDEGDVRIRSLASNAPENGQPSLKTATVSFRERPAPLQPSLENRDTWEFPSPGLTTQKLIFDTRFDGFTPLSPSETDNDHTTDCILVHGWGGHAIGSFTSPQNFHVWPRDSLPARHPQLRIWTYGYPSNLKDSASTADFFDYSERFMQQLRFLRQKTQANKKTFPIIFIVHSLGGWILKEDKETKVWSRTGLGRKLLVTHNSAACGRDWEKGPEYVFSLHRDHFDLVKYTEAEDEYEIVLDVLGKLKENAVSVIQAKENLFLNEEDSRPAEEFTDDQQSCLQSLSFLEMSHRYHEISSAAGSTCKWLLEDPEYREWSEQRSGLFWVKGNPGSGKSTLMKHLLTDSEDRGGRDLIIASFFFHARGDPIQSSVLGLFRSLLHQLAQSISTLRQQITSKFLKRSNTEGNFGERWTWHEQELQAIFRDCVVEAAKVHRIRIFIDALDEAGKEAAVALIEFLSGVADFLSICFSCRHYPILALENGHEVCVEERNMLDIQNYVHHRLCTFVQQRKDKRSLLIQEEIIRKAFGSFQWVKIVVTIVLGLSKGGEPLKAIQDRVRSLPPELDELYMKLLEDADEDKVPQTLQLMQWVLFAMRPLTLEELRFAMAMDSNIEETSISQCQDSDRYVESDGIMKVRVRELSRGLVEVVEQEREPVAQFVHQSVVDYLLEKGLKHLDQSRDWAPDGTMIGRGHFRLSRSCLKYLAMEGILERIRELQEQADRQERKANQTRLMHNLPFLEYATVHWTDHIQEVEKENLSQEDLFSRFKSDPKLLRNCTNSLIWLWDLNYHRSRPAIDTTLLHIISQYGLPSTLSAGLKMNLDMDSADKDGRTPLSRAAQEGHEAVVKLLLARHDVNVDSADNIGHTPLSYAAERGREAVVKLLLARDDVKADSVDIFERTPLSYAAHKGQEAVVKLLLARDDVKANSVGIRGRTPLSYAAERGEEAVVKLLLARDDITINSEDKKGRTPLSYAAERSEKEVVELLLAQNDIIVNSEDKDGRTPLSYAARRGKEAVVELLLAQNDIIVSFTLLDRVTTRWCDY